MAEYYTLGASLPTLRADDYKSLPMSADQFVQELLSLATPHDRKQIELLLLSYDNQQLIRQLKDGEPTVVSTASASYSNYTVAELRHLISLIAGTDLEEDLLEDHATKRRKLSQHFPPYMISFVEEYISDQQSNRPPEYFYEDILGNAYYSYAHKHANTFVRTWMSFERNIALVLAATTARRYKLDVRKVLVGDSELVRLLRSGDWREITYLEEHEVVERVVKIGEELNPAAREHRIDDLKWSFLDQITFADTFSIDAMMAYYLKLRILERWQMLDREKGSEAFRAIVDALNSEGREGLRRYQEMSQKKNNRGVHRP